MTQIAVSRKVQRVYARGLGPGCIANTDTANPVYIGSNTGLTTSSTVLPPQASVAVDDADFFASTLSGPAVVVAQIPGASQYNNPVGVQIALSALGLAKDTSVKATTTAVTGVNSTLGAPAQDGTVSAVESAVNAPAYGPATHTDVITTGPAAITGGKKLSDVNTTLGIPAQSTDVTTTLPANIAATGVPLLTGSELVHQLSSVSLAPGATQTYGPYAAGQLGYEILLSAWAAVNTGQNDVSVEVIWSDAGTGITTGDELWWLCPGSGSGGNAHEVLGHGPTKGDQIEIILANAGNSAGNVSFAFTLLQNSRIYAADRWRTIQFKTSFLTNTFADPKANLLASTSISVGSGTGNAVTRVMPLYNGRVYASLQTASGTSDAELLILNFADQSNGGISVPSTTVFDGYTSSTGQLAAMIDLPRSQCQLQIINHNAASQNITCSVQVSEQAVL